MSTHPYDHLAEVPIGDPVTITGRVAGLLPRRTRQGQPWTSVPLTAGDDRVVVDVLPAAFETLEPSLTDGAEVQVMARVYSVTDGAAALVVSR